MAELSDHDWKMRNQEKLKRAPQVNDLVVHYKGGLYLVKSVAVDEKTGDVVVHYYSFKYRTTSSRPLFSKPGTPPEERYAFWDRVHDEKLGSQLRFRPLIPETISNDEVSHDGKTGSGGPGAHPPGESDNQGEACIRTGPGD